MEGNKEERRRDDVEPTPGLVIFSSFSLMSCHYGTVECEHIQLENNRGKNVSLSMIRYF